jgi:hypothetical protein
MRAGILGPLRDAIAELAAQRHNDIDDIDAVVTAETVYDLTHYFMNARVLRRKLATAEEQEAVLMMCLRIVGVEDASV